jgi:hypothetical protein
MPAIATIVTRIRARLNETTPRFWQDVDLVEWYHEGAEQQHRIVLAMGRMSGRLTDIDHPYLKNFVKTHYVNVVVGTSLYELPGEYIDAFHFSLSDPSDVREQDAQYVPLSEHWKMDNLPQFGPTYDRPMWSLIADSTTGTVKLQVVVHGNRGVPNAPMTGRLYFFREIRRRTAAEWGDIPDPYNEGPIQYTLGQAAAKRQQDPTPFLSRADSLALAILAPPESIQVSQAEAQARTAQSQATASEPLQVSTWGKS